jgi:hypothetical protein
VGEQHAFSAGGREVHLGREHIGTVNASARSPTAPGEIVAAGGDIRHRLFGCS